MAFAFLSPHEEVRYVLERKDIIMKTNQIMIRPMGEFKVIQRTKDAFFNATDLLKQWNQLKGMKKEVNDYFDLSSTKEFIFTIMERENYDTGNYPYHKSRAFTVELINDSKCFFFFLCELYTFHRFTFNSIPAKSKYMF